MKGVEITMRSRLGANTNEKWQVLKMAGAKNKRCKLKKYGIENDSEVGG
jgi:hypothetical protein